MMRTKMARRIRIAKSNRRGLGKGTGSGYKNLIPKDPSIHSQSAKGIKQPQRVWIVNRIPKAKGKEREELIAEYDKILEKIEKIENKEEISEDDDELYDSLQQEATEIEKQLIGDPGRIWKFYPKKEATQ
jgi:hypothetical protein